MIGRARPEQPTEFRSAIGFQRRSRVSRLDACRAATPTVGHGSAGRTGPLALFNVERGLPCEIPLVIRDLALPGKTFQPHQRRETAQARD